MCDGCWNCAHACEIEALGADLKINGVVIRKDTTGYLCVVERDEIGIDGEMEVVGDYHKCPKWVSV